jgi:hypothetical protein
MKALRGIGSYLKALGTRDLPAAQQFAVTRPITAATVLATFTVALTGGLVVAIGARGLVVLSAVLAFCFAVYFAYFYYLALRTRDEFAGEVEKDRQRESG